MADSQIDVPEAPTAATAERTRRSIPQSTRRLLFILAGVAVLVGSVLGFYFTSDAFDERIAVTVAARDIEVGETLSAEDLTSALVVIGSLPHVPWTLGAPFDFEGRVAIQPIPLNALVRHDMVIGAETAPVGPELEVIVPLDLSLATDGVTERDLVLLADPGLAPSEIDPGRPRRVVREFALTNFEGSQMRLFLPPEEWAEWEQLLADVGGVLMVVPIGLGGDAAETTERLNTVWSAQWAAANTEIAQAIANERPTAGPGELEVVVVFDTSLVPTAFDPDALVLLIDPGFEPLGNDPGMPRSVISTLQLEGFSAGQMTMFVQPEEWLYWRSLPEELGATPMVVPVPEGTDIEDMTRRLNSEWRASWQRSIDELIGER